MINQQLMDAFKDQPLNKKATVEVRVEMRPSKLMDKLANLYLLELRRVSGYASIPELNDLEEKDILKYLYTLVWMRVQHSTSNTDKSFNQYRGIYQYLTVPVLTYQYLISIGTALDEDYMIRFVPEFTIVEDQLLSPNEMKALSDLILRQQQNGFKVVVGLPNCREGELEFMALCHVEGTVVGYRKSHPSYGFLASFFEQQKLTEITGLMCRILYGYDTDYDMQVQRLMSSISGV